MSDIYRPMPIASFSQGFGTGQNIGAVKQQTLLQKQQVQAQQAQAQLEASKEMRRNELSQKFYSGSATREEMTELLATTPKAQQDAMESALLNVSNDEKEYGVRSLAPIYASLNNGETEVAISLLEDLSTAYENSGDTKTSKHIETLINLTKTGEKGAKVAEFSVLQMLEGFGAGEVIDNQIALNEERRTEELQPGVVKQQLLDAGYKEAQTNKLLVETKKLDNEIQKDLNKNDGVLSLEDSTKYQDGIRTEFLKYTNTSRDAATKVGKINAVADRAIANSTQDEAVQGVSDLALINSFQRLIDDGVVRGEDVALAMNTAGGGAKLANAWNNFTKGDVLTPDQRLEFKAVAGILEEQENKAIAIVRDLYMPKITKLGLDPTETFGPLYVNIGGDGVTAVTKEPVTNTPAIIPPTETVPDVVEEKPVVTTVTDGGEIVEEW